MFETVVRPEAEFSTVQNCSQYTAEEHEVWGILYRRRMKELASTASGVFLHGAEVIGLSDATVPRLESVNQRLSGLTGWNAVPVTGFIPAKDFFRCLAQRRFPTTITVRPRESLEYVPAPDIFHDVFGHVPLHANPVVADFLQRFGALAAEAIEEEDVKRMARLFWFTVEFGLVREDHEVKAYGSGLISSSADAANALGPTCDRRPFDVQAVMSQPFEIDRLQDVLFVVESFDQLFEAIQQV